MKEIVKTLLLEGIDEEVIHRVLNVIAEDDKFAEKAEKAGLSPEKIKKARTIPSSTGVDYEKNPTEGSYRLTKKNSPAKRTKERQEPGDYASSIAKTLEKHGVEVKDNKKSGLPKPMQQDDK